MTWGYESDSDHIAKNKKDSEGKEGPDHQDSEGKEGSDHLNSEGQKAPEHIAEHRDSAE